MAQAAFTLAVGPRSAGERASGRDVQEAIDAVSTQGGGIVVLRPGVYELEDSVRLRSHVDLRGGGSAVFRRKGPLVWSDLALDADHNQTEITPRNIEGFHPGMGLVLRDDDQPNPMSNMPVTVTAVQDGHLYIDRHLQVEVLAERGARVYSYFPLVCGHAVEGVTVEGLVLDAAVEDVGRVRTLRSSGVHFWRSRGCCLLRVTARNCAGDGICSGTSRDMVFEECTAEDNVEYGIHPGGHSPHCRVARCSIHGNGADGLYICWGVRDSTVEDNDIHHNGHIKIRAGISIGHKDTDNLIVGNRIHDNVGAGIYFRTKTEANGAHRNTFRGNLIENNGLGLDRGYEVHVCGTTRDLLFEGNTLRFTGSRAGGHRQTAFRLCRGVSRVTMRGNVFEGYGEDAILDESGDGNLIQKVQVPAAPAAGHGHDALPETYREPFSASLPVRLRQHGQVRDYLTALAAESSRKRKAFAASMPQEELRKRFLEMVGYPPPRIKDGPLSMEKVGEDRHTEIFRTWAEVLEGVEVYGIYMRPRGGGTALPLLVAQHGGGGCPEAICGLDIRVNYHSFGFEAVKNGYAVWAPGLLMNVSYGGDPPSKEDRHSLDRTARLFATGIVAIEMRKILAGLEALLAARKELNGSRVGMAGLSYGGFFTLFAMAASPRIRAGVCSAFYRQMDPTEPSAPCDPTRLTDTAFPGMMDTFDLVGTAALIRPRPLLVQNGSRDTVVPIAAARRAASETAALYGEAGVAENFEFHEHDGEHEFRSDRIFDFFNRHLGG